MILNLYNIGSLMGYVLAIMLHNRWHGWHIRAMYGALYYTRLYIKGMCLYCTFMVYKLICAFARALDKLSAMWHAVAEVRRPSNPVSRGVSNGYLHGGQSSFHNEGSQILGRR